MTAVRSLSTAGSSSACEGRATRARVDRIAAQTGVRALIFSSSKSEGLELGRIRQKIPERVAQASACARVKSEPPRGGTAPPRSEQQAPTAPSPVEQSQPLPAEPPPKVTEQPPMATEPPKPAEPSQSKGTQPSQSKPSAPAPPKPPEPPRPRQGAAPSPPTQERAAIVDLTSLEQRLRDTHAIGVFTKLALKNDVDDLLERFRAFHAGRGGRGRPRDHRWSRREPYPGQTTQNS